MHGFIGELFLNWWFCRNASSFIGLLLRENLEDEAIQTTVS